MLAVLLFNIHNYVYVLSILNEAVHSILHNIVRAPSEVRCPPEDATLDNYRVSCKYLIVPETIIAAL